MAEIQPFKAHFDEARVTDLKERLSRSLFPDELSESGWDLGSPLTDIQRLAKHWSTFDFAQAESQINALPQFQTKIACKGFNPLNIHFIHVRSSSPTAIPLLFSHGWPGSFLEVYKIAKPLAEPSSGVSFHIVAPSLPNFGFSNGVKKRGFAIEHYAEVCHNLMLRLGYDRYVTQGGDWGWYVTRAMSLLYPRNVVATHFNMDVGDPPADLVRAQPGAKHPLPPDPSAREIRGATRTRWFDDEGAGYNLLQSTKPQTIAYALQDSPAALLAWIYEKLHDWSDAYPWTDDEICLWTSVYWFSKAGPGAAGRIYYEMEHDKGGRYVPHDHDGKGIEGVDGTRKMTRKWMRMDHGTGVKIGQSHFPKDIHVLPGAWTRTIGDVVFEVEHESGGHFAAHERPDELVADLREMFGQLDLKL